MADKLEIHFPYHRSNTNIYLAGVYYNDRVTSIQIRFINYIHNLDSYKLNHTVAVCYQIKQ